MPRKRPWPPRIVTRRGKDYVILYSGKKSYERCLGDHGTEAARAEYLRIVTESEQTGQARHPLPQGEEMTLMELCTSFLDAHPLEDVRSAARYRRAFRAACTKYGYGRAVDFGPRALQVIQQDFAREGLSRRYCNHLVNCLRSLFRWAVSQELVPVDRYSALQTVGGLRRGSSPARETEAVRPVILSDVEATLEHLSTVVASMVRLQLATGMRPVEVCRITPADVNQKWLALDGQDIWLYERSHHKNAHRGHRRAIPIGPRGQQVLKPFLDRAHDLPCFSPRESWEESQRKVRSTSAKRCPGIQWSTQAYGKSILRGCHKAGVSPWSPNQIRHWFATHIETELGREDARCALGHANPQTTAIYAEQIERAARVVAKFG